MPAAHRRDEARRSVAHEFEVPALQPRPRIEGTDRLEAMPAMKQPLPDD